MFYLKTRKYYVLNVQKIGQHIQGLHNQIQTLQTQNAVIHSQLRNFQSAPTVVDVPVETPVEEEEEEVPIQEPLAVEEEEVHVEEEAPSAVEEEEEAPLQLSREFGHHLVLNHKQTTQPLLHATHIDLAASLSADLPQTNLELFEESYTLVGATPYPMVVLDQGNLGACVANAFAGITQCLVGNTPSRLYLYFNARVATGNSPTDDSGLDLCQSLPILNSYGMPPELIWNYTNLSKFSTMPPWSVYKSSSITTKNVIYTSIPQTDVSIMSSINAKAPILFGMNVYQSFMTNEVAATGIIPSPNTDKEQLEGGHCVSIVGWTLYNNTEYYIIRNSWGTNWGNTGAITHQSNNSKNGGFAYIPKTYVLNPSLAFEFYSIKYQ